MAVKACAKCGQTIAAGNDNPYVWDDFIAYGVCKKCLFVWLIPKTFRMCWGMVNIFLLGRNPEEYVMANVVKWGNRFEPLLQKTSTRQNRP